MDSAKRQSFDLFSEAKKIYSVALAEVEPENLIKRNVSIREKSLIIRKKSFDLGSFDNIFLVAIGKAAPYMAKSLLNILKDRVKEGIVLYLPQNKICLRNINCLPASHPLPDKRSFTAAQDIINLAKRAGEKDLILVLVSGGGSAQICLPAQGVTLKEKRAITDRLIREGASITELNTVRKHLSRIKGGHLAQAAFPGTVINLVISDVIHNDLESIASGPTYWDSSTYADAFQVLKRYNLWDSASGSIREVINNGMKGRIEETLKKDDFVFSRVYNFIIGDNCVALQAAKKEAQKLGFKAFVITSSDQGEAKDVARSYTSILTNLTMTKKETFHPLCLLSGGELTVTVRGKGRGGRNQEFALALLNEMKSQQKAGLNWLVLSLGSDGVDGPTDAAGALVSESTLEKAQQLSLDPQKFLDNNDSYNFFKQVGGLVVTGPTHTNVMDFRIFLIAK